MPEISVADIEQRYRDCVVMYKRKPVKVKAVNGKGDLRILDLFSQREDTVPFSLKDFVPPALRLGFININGSVVYATRIPMRRYKVGFSRENVSVSAIPGIEYPEKREATIEKAMKLDCIEIADALLNKYPTKRQAVNYVMQFGGARAFDKQFAVNGELQVFYKKDCVGYIDPSSYEISFKDGWKHLGILLDKAFEKSIRSV